MADNDAFLNRYQSMTDKERRLIKEWYLPVIVDSGVRPVALMFAYTNVHGRPDNSRDEYIGILKGP